MKTITTFLKNETSLIKDFMGYVLSFSSINYANKQNDNSPGKNHSIIYKVYSYIRNKQIILNNNIQ